MRGPAALLAAVPLLAVAGFSLVVHLTGIAPVPWQAPALAAVLVACGALVAAGWFARYVRRAAADPAGWGRAVGLDVVCDRVDASERATRGFIELAEQELAGPPGTLDRFEAVLEDLAVLADATAPGFVRPARVGLAALTLDAEARLRALADRDWTLEQIADGDARLDRARVLAAVQRLGRHAARQTTPGDAVRFGSRRRGATVTLWVGWEPYVEREAGATGLRVVEAVAVAHGGALLRPDEAARRGWLGVELPSEPG